MAVSLQGANPVTEPGDDGASTNVMLCASVSSSPGVIERNTVITVSSTEGTAGTELQFVGWLYPTVCQAFICTNFFKLLKIYLSSVHFIVVTAMIVIIQVHLEVLCIHFRYQ